MNEEKIGVFHGIDFVHCTTTEERLMVEFIFKHRKVSPGFIVSAFGVLLGKSPEIESHVISGDDAVTRYGKKYNKYSWYEPTNQTDFVYNRLTVIEWEEEPVTTMRIDRLEHDAIALAESWKKFNWFRRIG